MTADPDALLSMLTRLKLTCVRDRLDSLLDDAARRELTLREALAWMCAAEVALRDQRRFTMGLSPIGRPCARPRGPLVALVRGLCRGWSR